MTKDLQEHRNTNSEVIYHKINYQQLNYNTTLFNCCV